MWRLDEMSSGRESRLLMSMMVLPTSPTLPRAAMRSSAFTSSSGLEPPWQRRRKVKVMKEDVARRRRRVLKQDRRDIRRISLTSFQSSNLELGKEKTIG